MENENNTQTLEKPDEQTQNNGGIITEAPKQEMPIYGEKTAEIEKRQLEIEEQDKKLLAALDEVLEKRSKRIQSEHIAPVPKTKKIPRGFGKKGVGFISLGLILIFLGVVMIGCLFSPEPNFLLPLKLSPICAVLIGLEILFNQVATRGNFRINIPSIIISALLVVGCCVMCVTMNKNFSKQKEEYNNRTIAAQIYEKSYKELRYVADIESLEVQVDLNPDGTGKTKGLEALSADDYVNITVKFAGVIDSPRKFASNCKKIIDGYRFMGINVTNFFFENESAYHIYNLTVEGKYVQDYSESKLEELVTHIYIENMSYFEDLKDLDEESEEKSDS